MQPNPPASARPPRRPRIRHCPVCGVSMQADKSHADLAEFDLFRCLSCATTIDRSKPTNGAR